MTKWLFDMPRTIYQVVADFPVTNGESIPAGTIVEFLDSPPPNVIAKEFLKPIGVQNLINGHIQNEYPPVDVLMWKNWIISRTATYTDDRRVKN